MDNEVKEILMQLLDTTNKLAEGQKETNKRLDNIENDITEIKEDITELKRETKITRVNVNHNGEVLEQMVKDLAPLNMLNVKY